MMRSKFSTMSCATAFVTGNSAHDDDGDEARILPPHTTCSGNNKELATHTSFTPISMVATTTTAFTTTC